MPLPRFAGLCVENLNALATVPSEMTSDDSCRSSLRRAKSARRRGRLGICLAAPFPFGFPFALGLGFAVAFVRAANLFRGRLCRQQRQSQDQGQRESQKERAPLSR